MPCQRCIQAIQEAGNALQEMAFCDPDTLPPGRDWAEFGADLVRLAGHLRTHTTHEEPQYGRNP